MMARRGVLGVMAGGLGILLGACRSSKHATYRFAMTVEVETPVGVISGKSVCEVRVGDNFGLDPSGYVRKVAINGEAAWLEINGRTLFALLKTANIHTSEDLAFSSMATLDPQFKGGALESASRIAAGQGALGPVEVSFDRMPILVTFVDHADPKSVELVDPKNLANHFGEGVRLRRVLMERTELAVSSTIDAKLPSFGQSTGFDAWRRELPYGDARAVSISDFKQGMNP